uniref:C2H2-type domain-containing protein n=1 Tax=Oreochromis aureus TaxID=47969 RepID=A0AAZ1Y5I2_OREAU
WREFEGSVCSTTAFHSLPLFVSLSLQDQHGARSQRSQEADKPHRRKREKTYTCDECGKGFTGNASLKQHQVIHTGERPFSCDLCGKSFSRKGYLKQHQLIHSGVKAYSCDQCGRAFTQSGQLQKHLVTHSGIKAYSCDICGKTFSQRGTRNTHLRIHTQRRRLSRPGTLIRVT